MRLILMLGLVLYSSILTLISILATYISTISVIFGIASGVFIASALTLFLALVLLNLIKKFKGN